MRLLNEPAFLENIGDKRVRTSTDAEAYIETAGTKNYAEHGFGMCKVVQNSTQEPIGICGFLKRDFFDCPDIGFAFLEHSWNQGFATEATQAMLSWATNQLHSKRIVAFTNMSNVVSIRVLQKIGFLSLGELDLPENKGRCHVLEYACTRL